MKKLNIPPYHVFEYKENFFAFDINKSHFIKISEIAYDHLRDKLQESSDSRVTAKLSSKYSKNRIDALKTEIGLLKRQGYFKKYAYTYDDAENAYLRNFQ